MIIKEPFSLLPLLLLPAPQKKKLTPLTLSLLALLLLNFNSFLSFFFCNSFLLIGEMIQEIGKKRRSEAIIFFVFFLSEKKESVYLATPRSLCVSIYFFSSPFAVVDSLYYSLRLVLDRFLVVVSITSASLPALSPLLLLLTLSNYHLYKY